ncbi:MAG: MATE family efflux transporter [Kofleriaceae bacterium]|nr:MATE family efflux transporter [Kofleriaceae bacterium]
MPPSRDSELRAIIRLMIPLALADAGYQLLAFVDAAMVGHYGTAALGGVGIGNGIFFSIMCLGMGCVMGMDTLVAQALGAGEEAHAREILAAGVRLAIWLSVPCAALAYGVVCLLPAFGVQPAIAEAAHQFVLGRLINATPFMAFIAMRSYLQAKGQTRPIVVGMIAVVSVNLVANALLVFGDEGLVWVGLPGIGLPALGPLGSGLGTSIASFASIVVLAVAIKRGAPPASTRAAGTQREIARRIVRLGLPIGFQYIGEMGIYTLLGILAGRMSEAAAAANQIGMMLATAIAGISIGLSTAITVRVGLHVGAGDTPRARSAGFLGMRVGIVVLLSIAIVFLLVPGPIARAFTSDPAVHAIAMPLIVTVGFCQLADGVQIAGTGALRGIGDTRSPLMIVLVGHYLVGLPVAVYLGFELDLATSGLWWGVTGGLAVAALALALRFSRLTSRRIQRA